MRKQRRFLASIGVSCDSEHNERAQQSSLIGDHVHACHMHLSHRHKIADDKHITRLQKTAITLIKSLPTFVDDILNKYDECGMLAWESKNIPEDEIWIKIGGDHGGGSFKLCLQVLNCDSPNARNKTFVICMFNAKDYHCNLQKALYPFRTEITLLQRMRWKGRNV